MSMKNDYEEDESNVIEYTESSVEDYFNTYMRLEQKYTMRPRYGIARAIYERSLRDEAIENFDKSTWYTCDTSKLSPELIASFTQLSLDEETQAFLNASSEKSNAVFTQLYHSIVKILLKPFLCQTSINGSDHTSPETKEEVLIVSGGVEQKFQYDDALGDLGRSN
ncbi:hypothetical protein M8J75_003297 [Diaphorina citri]|nr:hypothetical protein M8J75_003297 [Diaphorina citri]